MTEARLILDDGTTFGGTSFGAAVDAAGEVVFNTAMTGYPESLTDPSYAGQILVMTYPLVGNYGVPSGGGSPLPERWESDRIHVRGLVVADYSPHYSHWEAREALGAWMEREGITGITGIDTRRLTRTLRERGVIGGRIVVGPADAQPRPTAAEAAYGAVNWVSRVSCPDVITYNRGARRRVVIVDCGVKAGIIRCLVRRGLEVVRVPWDYDFNRLAFDGLFVANGPGDPAQCGPTVAHLRAFMASADVRPLMGICLGNQLIARAAGAQTYKLKYGHRSHNQPVRLVGTDRCFITSQNHGYAVDADTLPAGWRPLFVNMNDGSNEGICHRQRPWYSAQFHPEACSGPVDTEWMFDAFAALVERRATTMPADLIALAAEAAPDQPTSAHFADLAAPAATPLSAATPLATDGQAPAADAGPLAAPGATRPATGRAIRKVLLLGSGALKIGQAGEFDYSGAQALKALRQEGIESVLINPNVATVQTSQGVADRVYFLPVTPDFVERVIARERPDGILLSFGGQTALNCGVELSRRGVLERYGTRVLGTPVQTIIDTEDRDLFVRRLDEIGVQTIRSQACNTREQVREAAHALGYPVILRAAYALGGLGSGFCDDDAQLEARADEAFSFSPQVLVERSLRGWKEIEYEVVRDRQGNCITVCNMENLDPLGIHTGESIVVAPSQTLSNHEYHRLRALAIRIVSHLGIVGECNVQYALDPTSDDYRVIEVNARLSRSSALASKATGYPLAFVAAKLALGYSLADLTNSVTKTTTAFFEPALDYVVCKIPRWDLTKFHGVDHELGSSMKSVGEVMAIGRTFEEAIQKGLRMIGQGMHGLVGNKPQPVADIARALSHATDMRIFVVARALAMGYTVDQIHALTRIDRWFLMKLRHIVDIETRLRREAQMAAVAADIDPAEQAEYLGQPEVYGLLREAKVYGFSDFQIARALGLGEDTTMDDAALTVRRWRQQVGLTPVVHQIDTLAAEYPAQTNYLYVSYL